MTVEALEIKPSGTSAEQLAAYSVFLSRVFGPQPKFSVAALTWLYRDNPDGAVVGMDAWAGERLAAHYVTIPMRARVQGVVARGLLALNTATDPDFQGKGLFTRLAASTYEVAAQAGFQFVTGFANANATPALIGKLAFQNVRRLRAGLLLFPPRDIPTKPTQFEADWSAESLAWRLANPAARYTVTRRGGVLDVRSRTSIPLLNCAAFLQATIDVEAPDSTPWLPSLFIGLEPRLALETRGFVPIPERLRPSPLNMIWRVLDANLPAALDPDQVAISFLDFDPY